MFVHVCVWIPGRKTLGKKHVCFLALLQKASELSIVAITSTAAFSRILAIAVIITANIVTIIIIIIISIPRVTSQWLQRWAAALTLVAQSLLDTYPEVVLTQWQR